MIRRFFRPKKTRKERGAELVELTLVFPLLLFIGLGMLDAGMAYKSKMEVVQATRQGARVGSSFGDEDESDQEAVLALASVIQDYLFVPAGDTTSVRLDFIVLYKADAADGAVPPACLTPGYYQNDVCTNMTRTDVESFLNDVAANPGTLQLNRFWDNRPTEPDNLESLGVYIQATQPSFTGILKDLQNWTVAGSTVMRTEPDN